MKNALSPVPLVLKNACFHTDSGYGGFGFYSAVKVRMFGRQIFPHGSARRGSAMALTIVLSIVLTGLAVTLSWLGTVHANMAGQIPKMDASFYAAEAGAQHAIWKFKHDNSWHATSASPFTGTIDMCGTTWTYAVTCTDAVGDATLAWKLDENNGTTTADSSGHGNTGTLHGGVSWFNPGRSGACVSMNGTDGYIDCGNNASTNLTGDMTFSAWVKMNSGYYDQKIGGNESGTGGGYKLCIYNSKVEFEVRDAQNNPHLNRDVAGGTVLVMGTWYHIMGVYSESGHYIKTYVNGTLDRTLLGDGTGSGYNSVPVNALGSTTGNFVMGKEPWAALYFFNGYMDDIRIWNRVLSPQEALALHDTTVAIHSSVTGGPVANFTDLSCSIPSPAPPTIPAVTTGQGMIVYNITVNGDLSVNGPVTCTTGTSTVSGDLNYTGTYLLGSHLTVKGNSHQIDTVNFPTIDYANLQNQATSSGQVVNGDSIGQTFSFNNLGGNKVIWIKGNLTDPIVSIGGTFAAGGTFVVDGAVTFSSSATTLGAAGYPVYIVAQGNITQSGANLNLTGALYTTGSLSHKTCTITGPVVANQTITNNATAQCTFTAGAIPWFDNRIIPQPPTLPLYTASHKGNGP